MPTNPAEYMQKYYKDNRNNILKRMKEPVLCETCNISITRSNFSKHLTSRKHKKLVESENKKQISMKEITDKIGELKQLVERVEALGHHNKPENVLRKVFGSLGRKPESKKEEESSTSDTNYAPDSESD